jgi:hypothetical protein
MQPVETWIVLARTRNTEENETLSRSLFRKMIADTWSTQLPSICTPHQPSLTILYTWQNLM